MRGQTVMMLLIFAVAMMLGAPTYAGDRETLSLDFGPAWELGWRHKGLGSSPTRYLVVEEDGRDVLMALSRNSASALWTSLDQRIDESMELSWRWKVTRGLGRRADERVKSGDDYPARVLVAFGPNPFSKDVRALCYVWANEQPVGALYESPYSRNIATIVVRSGESELGKWLTESRSVVDDYRRAFGERPSKIYALGVMVDTDNTKSRATAWFSHMNLSSQGRFVGDDTEPSSARR